MNHVSDFEKTADETNLSIYCILSTALCIGGLPLVAVCRVSDSDLMNLLSCCAVVSTYFKR